MNLAAARALSLSRPWPYAILQLDKRIENRSDKRGMPPMCRYRGPLLLHAAKSWDADAGPWMAERNLLFWRQRQLHDPAEDAMFGDSASYARRYGRGARKRYHSTGIVGVCHVVGHVEPLVPDRGAVAAVVLGRGQPGYYTEIALSDRIVRSFWDAENQAAEFAEALDLRWWMGGYALVLADVVALPEPVPCRGRLGLWRPTESEVRAVTEQLTQ